MPGIFISGISFVMEERAGNPGKIFPGFSVTFLKRVRLISEKGGKRTGHILTLYIGISVLSHRMERWLRK